MVYCQRQGISRKTGWRLIRQKELRVVGRRRSRHGKPAILVKVADTQHQPKRKHKPVWVRFRDACQTKECDPHDVLLRLVMNSKFDPDLLHAGIRLVCVEFVVDHKYCSRFLDFLTDKIPGEENNFVSFVANRLKADVPVKVLRDAKKHPFYKLWANLRHEVRRWQPDTELVFGRRQSTPEVSSLMHRPSYHSGAINVNPDAHLNWNIPRPDWARESICSVNRKQRGLYTKVIPKLLKALGAPADWDDLGWLVNLIPHRLDALCARFHTRAENSILFHHATQYAAGFPLQSRELPINLIADKRGKRMPMLTQLGLTSVEARSLLRTWTHRRQGVNHLSRTDANRVFCLSR